MPTPATPFTLTKVLRGEWRFDGFVVSDYTSVEELLKHGVAADGREAAQLALNAGVEMEMVSRLYNTHGAELVRGGKLTPARLDEAVRRILRIKFRLASSISLRRLAREPRPCSTRAPPAPARCRRSMVLLKNERTPSLDSSSAARPHRPARSRPVNLGS